MSVKLTTITLQPSGRQFECLPGRSILEAGLAAGLALPFSCANGSCGDCRATVLQGDITQTRFHDYVLSAAEKIAGVCLMCSNASTTEVVLEVKEATSVSDIPAQTLKAKRCRTEQLKNVTVVGFKFVRGKAFRFLPGQKATVAFPSGQVAELPVASCPCNAQFVEFHLPHDGRCAELIELTRSLNTPDRVLVSGPTGHFTLSPDQRRPKLFIAVGVGFASIQGLVEHLHNLELDTPSMLVWQATDSIGHYRHNLCRSWADAIDEFSYRPVDNTAAALQVANDFLQHHAMDAEVYINGPVADIDKIRQQLIELGVQGERVFTSAEVLTDV